MYVLTSDPSEEKVCGPLVISVKHIFNSWSKLNEEGTKSVNHIFDEFKQTLLEVTLWMSSHSFSVGGLPPAMLLVASPVPDVDTGSCEGAILFY